LYFQPFQAECTFTINFKSSIKELVDIKDTINHTLNSSDEQQQNQSSSCDDLVSVSKAAVWYQQSLKSPAFVPEEYSNTTIFTRKFNNGGNIS
jgi:hypothetical protein